MYSYVYFSYIQNKSPISPMVKKQIESSSAQWSNIDYRLQMITGKSSIQILSLSKHTAPSASQDFKTESVLNVTGLDREYIEKALRNGLGSQEMVFYCGHLNIHQNAKPGKIFHFLLCRLDLGRIGRVKDQLSLADSVLLQSEAQRDAFQYNFMVSHSSRYWVEYEVTFTLGTQKQFAENDFLCMNCQNKRARVYCANQQLQLCEQCSKDHHSRRIMSNHQLQKIDKVNTLPLCSKHQQKLKHYCSICAKYLCYVCLQKGNSHGNNQHPVNDIIQLYGQKREITESISARQKDQLQGIIRSLGAKRDQIEENYVQTKKIIQSIFEKSLRKLNDMYGEKAFLIRSEELELRMMSQKLQWAKTFIRFQEKNLKPIYYFQAQQKFQHQLSKVRPAQPRSLIYLKPDLAVEGQLLVGKRQQLGQPLRQIAEASRISQQTTRRDPNIIGKQVGLYEYDSRAEAPLGGQLHLALTNTKLNFFSRNFLFQVVVT